MTRHKWAAFTVMALAQFADAVSTHLSLAAGAVELNPLVRTLGLGPAKLLALAIAAVVVYRARKMWLVWASCIVYGIIVLSNLSLAFL